MTQLRQENATLMAVPRGLWVFFLRFILEKMHLPRVKTIARGVRDGGHGRLCLPKNPRGDLEGLVTG